MEEILYFVCRRLWRLPSLDIRYPVSPKLPLLLLRITNEADERDYEAALPFFLSVLFLRSLALEAEATAEYAEQQEEVKKDIPENKTI